MFNCKLNSKYKKALKWKQADAYDEDPDECNWESKNSLQCCGIDELIVGDHMDRDTPKNRFELATNIQSHWNNDKRVLIVGLPIGTKDENDLSYYQFKNYKVIRKILLDFGMKQVTTRPYINSNTDHKLSVLVGQFP